MPGIRCESLLSTRPSANERILHPYFDEILRERLLVAKFDVLGLVPRIELRSLLEPEHPLAAAVSFHIENVVERTSILRHLRTSWNNLIRRPSLAAAELRSAPVSRETLKEILVAELDRQDDTHGSCNNWQSVFLAGLLTPSVVDWLFDAFHQPEWEDDGPLVAGVV